MALSYDNTLQAFSIKIFIELLSTILSINDILFFIKFFILIPKLSISLESLINKFILSKYFNKFSSEDEFIIEIKLSSDFVK